MATANLNELIDKVRRLPSEKLRQVEELVAYLESEGNRRTSPFRAVAGTLDAEDANVMAKVIEDCERIEQRGW